MVAKWGAAVKTLALVAVKYPQTAYAGFTFCLQNEWQYLQRVVADTGPFFDPLEKAIRSKFIPALLGLRADEITGKYWELLTHSVTKGGWHYGTQWTRQPMSILLRKKQPFTSLAR